MILDGLVYVIRSAIHYLAHVPFGRGHSITGWCGRCVGKQLAEGIRKGIEEGFKMCSPMPDINPEDMDQEQPEIPCDVCTGDSAAVACMPNGEGGKVRRRLTSQEWCMEVGECAATIDWEKVFGHE